MATRARKKTYLAIVYSVDQKVDTFEENSPYIIKRKGDDIVVRHGGKAYEAKILGNASKFLYSSVEFCMLVQKATAQYFYRSIFLLSCKT